MYVTKTPAVVKALYSSLVWNMPRTAPSVYLTFDDGPHPKITTEVIHHLNQYKAKATFFCIGKNIQQHPEILSLLQQNGHSLGNHTYNHLNGWKTPDFTYYRNVVECSRLLTTNLFRPPYGKITRRQASTLSKTHKIIMWDVLSADFDPSISKEKCLDNVLKNIQPGSIVVFHDSEKAAEKMLYTLPKVLDFIESKKWTCAAI